MNQVEAMQGQLAALSRRLEKLEALAAARGVATRDDIEAQKVAQSAGFTVDILILPERIEERKELAELLRVRGWGYERIARVFNCSPTTVKRWQK